MKKILVPCLVIFAFLAGMGTLWLYQEVRDGRKARRILAQKAKQKRARIWKVARMHAERIFRLAKKHPQLTAYMRKDSNWNKIQTVGTWHQSRDMGTGFVCAVLLSAERQCKAHKRFEYFCSDKTQTCGRYLPMQSCKVIQASQCLKDLKAAEEGPDENNCSL